MDGNNWISCMDRHPECNEHGLSNDVHVQIKVEGTGRIMEDLAFFDSNTKCWKTHGSMVFGQVIAWRPVTEEKAEEKDMITKEQYKGLHIGLAKDNMQPVVGYFWNGADHAYIIPHNVGVSYDDKTKKFTASAVEVYKETVAVKMGFTDDTDIPLFEGDIVRIGDKMFELKMLDIDTVLAVTSRERKDDGMFLVKRNHDDFDPADGRNLGTKEWINPYAGNRKPPKGIELHGAYWNSTMLGLTTTYATVDEILADGFDRYTLNIKETQGVRNAEELSRSGSVRIWARNEEEAKRIIRMMPKEELDEFSRIFMET